jgi:hypothetical protein
MIMPLECKFTVKPGEYIRDYWKDGKGSYRRPLHVRVAVGSELLLRPCKQSRILLRANKLEATPALLSMQIVDD